MLSDRLQAILECVGSCEVLADIGTDHAYLPIEACRAGVCKIVIACDVNPGPLKMADFNIRSAGLSDRIETRLGDGLQPLNPNEADCIVIAGMGGMRIWQILTDEPQKARSFRLILQPQHDLEQLRKNLHSFGMEITDEKLVREGSRFYVIICAEAAQNICMWTDKEYFLGKKNGADWQLYLDDRYQKIAKYIHSINDEAQYQAVSRRLKWLEDAM